MKCSNCSHPIAFYRVVANSGYWYHTEQVDLGDHGTWCEDEEEQAEPGQDAAEEAALEAEWRYRNSFVLGDPYLPGEDDDTIEHWVRKSNPDASPDIVYDAVDIITNMEEK